MMDRWMYGWMRLRGGRGGGDALTEGEMDG